VSDWLKDGENGIVVKQRDTSAFAFALDKLACDPALREKLGDNGYSFVAKNFSKEKFLKSFLELI
jgi:glycosyltransferase involved in cell wall biosynthesis